MLSLFHLYLLNMFRTLICPSSGACDYDGGLPRRLSYSLFVVCWGLLRVMLGGIGFAGWSTTVLFVLHSLTCPIPGCHWQSQHNLNPTIQSSNAYFISWHYGTQHTQACHSQLNLVESTITSFHNTHLGTNILFTILSPNYLPSSNEIPVCIYHFLSLLKHSYLHAAGSFSRS